MTAPHPPRPHVCDYVDRDHTTAGACHLRPPHGGRCARGCVVDVAFGLVTAHAVITADARDCVHQPWWETVLLCGDPGCEVHR